MTPVLSTLTKVTKLAENAAPEYQSQNKEWGFYNAIRSSLMVQAYLDQVFSQVAKAVQQELWRSAKISATGTRVIQFMDSSLGRHLGDSLYRCTSVAEIRAWLKTNAKRLRSDWNTFVSRNPEPTQDTSI